MRFLLLLLPLLFTSQAAKCKETTVEDFKECLDKGYSPSSGRLSSCVPAPVKIPKKYKKSCKRIEKKFLKCKNFQCERQKPQHPKSPPVLGGWMKGNPQDRQVVETADAALRELSRRADDADLVVVKGPIMEVKQQVVAGMNYEISMLIGTTKEKCEGVKKGVADFQRCPPDSAGYYRISVYKSWDRVYAWEGMEKMPETDLAEIWNNYEE